MNPQEPVMRRRRAEDRVSFAETAESTLELCEETRHRAGADSHVLTDLDVVRAQFAGNNL